MRDPFETHFCTGRECEIRGNRKRTVRRKHHTSNTHYYHYSPGIMDAFTARTACSSSLFSLAISCLCLSASLRMSCAVRCCALSTSSLLLLSITRSRQRICSCWKARCTVGGRPLGTEASEGEEGTEKGQREREQMTV